MKPEDIDANFFMVLNRPPKEESKLLIDSPSQSAARVDEEEKDITEGPSLKDYIF
jgi:hypothetical protein